MKALSHHDRHFNSGVELFNQARFFDAHEALEDVWREVPLDWPLRKHLQGMVQLAVAFHHQSTGNLVGARSVLERALRNLQGGEASFPSLDFDLLRAELTPWRRFLTESRSMDAQRSAGPDIRSEAPALPKIMLRGDDR
jgi:predicted metal-dependent hydrolase